MAYEKHTWECGETVTADKLNHMEDGIAEGGGGSEPLIVTVSSDTGVFVMDKTFGEIRNAFQSGRTVIVIDDQTSGDNTSMNYSLVSEVYYMISDGDAYGTVNAHQAYDVSANEPPYTLEALDSQYPYYS